jgi:alpha-galactosidase
MDIDDERLDFAQKSVQKIVDMGGYPAKVETTMDRAAALDGADAVLVTILAGSTDVWRHDIEIPKTYGVDTNVGDTRGVSGIFRALRTIPVMVDIAKDMERYCPDATMLNYTNPMAMLCRAMQRETSHPAHRPLPQRAGHRDDAGEVDRRAVRGNHLHLRGHQPHGLVRQV